MEKRAGAKTTRRGLKFSEHAENRKCGGDHEGILPHLTASKPSCNSPNLIPSPHSGLTLAPIIQPRKPVPHYYRQPHRLGRVNRRGLGGRSFPSSHHPWSLRAGRLCNCGALWDGGSVQAMFGVLPRVVCHGGEGDLLKLGGGSASRAFADPAAFSRTPACASTFCCIGSALLLFCFFLA